MFRAICLPIITLGYRALLAFRRRVAFIYAWLQVRISHLLTAKHMLHVAVVAVTFLVTATNIYASGIPDPQQTDGNANTSILGGLFQGGNEVIVEGSDSSSSTPVTSYLQGQALSVNGGGSGSSSDAETLDGTDDGQYDDSVDPIIFESPLMNGVRVSPDANIQQEPSSDVSAPPTRSKIVDYTVQDGDTIGLIAQRFGISVASVVAANKIRGALIHPGQNLRILPVDGVEYIVKRGDTIQKIANTYKSNVSDILAYNGLSDASSVQIGTELVLPGGHLPPPPPPPSRFTSNIKNVFKPSPAPDRIGSGKLLWPVASYRITQYFKGARHTGIDIGAPTGTTIFAADDGIVEYAGWNSGGYGNMIIINHGSGLYTRYGHSSKLLVAVGQTVKRGDVIALVGSTGHSTGPHLHFEVMTRDIHHRLNPLDWVR